MLQTGRPVRFHLASATSDVQHIEPGAIVTIDDPERYRLLPPIAAVIDDAGDKEVPVVLAAALTEIGTLEMSCLAREGDRRWKLEFQLRGKAEQEGAARVAKLHPRFEEASERVRVIYGSSKDKSEIKPSEIKRVRRDLEQILGPREAWDTPLLRELFGSLLAGKKRRRRSADHERIWFNLVGYTLRPGFGYPLDKWRVQQIQDELLKAGVQFVKEAQNCSEYWIMWRRISGGLDREAQEKLMSTIAWYLHPPTRTPRKRPPGPKLEGYEDMVRLAGALERVDVQTKAQIGGWLVERLEKHQEHADTWWAVGRIGARVPFYGSAHEVVPRHVATQWLEAALRLDFKRTPQAALAATLLARRSGDRQRDLEDALREKVAARLQAAKASASWVRLVHEIAELQDDDQKRILGDSLPPGLRLID